MTTGPAATKRVRKGKTGGAVCVDSGAFEVLATYGVVIRIRHVWLPACGEIADAVP